jgi:hypothetical protein
MVEEFTIENYGDVITDPLLPPLVWGRSWNLAADSFVRNC